MTDPDEPTDLSPMDDTASSSPAGSPAGDPAPTRYELDPADRRTKLRENVIEAINALPFHFASPINIEGLDAGDLFQLNTLLGGAIEVQTVDTLNRIRSVWDPDDEWQDYGFKRFSQSFPDVRLVRGTTPNNPSSALSSRAGISSARKRSHLSGTKQRPKLQASGISSCVFRGPSATCSAAAQESSNHMLNRLSTPPTCGPTTGSTSERATLTTEQ